MRSILLLLAFFWANAGAFAEESSNALREAAQADYGAVVVDDSGLFSAYDPAQSRTTGLYP